MIDTRNEGAWRLLARYAFEKLPDQPRVVWLTMKAIATFFVRSQKGKP